MSRRVTSYPCLPFLIEVLIVFFSSEDASRYSENICAIGPLTQLIISSLVKASNESTAEDHNNLVSKKSSDGKAQSSESEEGDYKLFDWQKSRQDCRMENELRKELMKIG